jgi:hypothetical protein
MKWGEREALPNAIFLPLSNSRYFPVGLPGLTFNFPDSGTPHLWHEQFALPAPLDPVRNPRETRALMAKGNAARCVKFVGF